jgi:16S rRNA (cytosine1402-N4)-methyltransferase
LPKTHFRESWLSDFLKRFSKKMYLAKGDLHAFFKGNKYYYSIRGLLMIDKAPHKSVLLDEVLEWLKPADGKIYVDGTFGAGGYSKAILDKADCNVLAIDRDQNAKKFSAKLENQYKERFSFIHGCFGDVKNIIKDSSYQKVDGFVLDLGVSSMQLDQADRGFSFRYNAPLDMRMDQESSGITAAELINGYKEEDLADIIYKYGDERYSRRIAKLIVKERQIAPIEDTFTLADIIRRAVPKNFKSDIDPATKTFQAIRIYINEELSELESALEASESILSEGGRLVVVSFHSLEDRIVKRFIKQRSSIAPNRSRHLPAEEKDESDIIFSLPFKKPVLPSEKEVLSNPRSRSAKLRVAIRTGVNTSNNYSALNRESMI